MLNFRAAVLRAPGQPLSIETVSAGALQPTDVLIRVRASGLCHTDLEVIDGALARPLPVILGHEAAGIVEQVGSHVTGIRPGDAVVCTWSPACGGCFHCLRDAPILCEAVERNQPKGRLLDGGTRYRAGDEVVHHFSMVSSHAEYCIVPQAGCVVVPASIPAWAACLIGCGVSTGVCAVCRLAKVQAGDSVAVVGVGAVGINAIQAARLQHAGRIIAIDTDPAKRRWAEEFGCTDFIVVSGPDGIEDAASGVRGLTGGRGCDHVFECAGGEKALQLSLEATRKGGGLVILGKLPPSRMVQLRFGALMGERRIIRSSYGGCRPHLDFPWIAGQYLQGNLKLDELVTRRLPLEAINDGFDAMRRGEIVRAVLEFE